MYYYPSLYEARDLYTPLYYYKYFDYTPYYYNSPSYYLSKYGPKSVVTRYYYPGSGGIYSLIPRYSSQQVFSANDDSRQSRARSRESSVPRSVRASSIPTRASSPVPEENIRRSIRASSEPRETFPRLVHYSPKMADRHTPTSTYTYSSRVPAAPEEKSIQLISASPLSFGPKVYTNLSVFPTMRHSSCSLLAPIDRYRYRTSTMPSKVYRDFPSTSYYSYPTPTSSTYSSAYRSNDLYPTRFQINRITSPSVDSFHAGRRTLY